MRDTRDHGDRDDQRRLRGESQQDAGQVGLRALVRAGRPRRLCLPAAQAERAQCTQVVAKGVRVAAEHLDRLERTKGCVELSRVPVERVEREPDGLAVVALIAQRQVFDPRQRCKRRVG